MGTWDSIHKWIMLMLEPATAPENLRLFAPSRKSRPVLATALSITGFLTYDLLGQYEYRQTQPARPQSASRGSPVAIDFLGCNTRPSLSVIGGSSPVPTAGFESSHVPRSICKYTRLRVFSYSTVTWAWRHRQPLCDYGGGESNPLARWLFRESPIVRPRSQPSFGIHNLVVCLPHMSQTALTSYCFCTHRALSLQRVRRPAHRLPVPEAAQAQFRGSAATYIKGLLAPQHELSYA